MSSQVASLLASAAKDLPNNRDEDASRIASLGNSARPELFAALSSSNRDIRVVALSALCQQPEHLQGLDYLAFNRVNKSFPLFRNDALLAYLQYNRKEAEKHLDDGLRDGLLDDVSIRIYVEEDSLEVKKQLDARKLPHSVEVAVRSYLQRPSGNSPSRAH